MRTDHAFLITDQQVAAPILIFDYLVRKSNRLGLQGRQIVRVYMEEDTEGKHIYFETCETQTVG